MSHHDVEPKTRARDLKPLWLLIALIAITAFHYETVGGSALLHEISQRLYYLPIIYAAYRYGLRGGLTASLVSAALYFPHIVQHWANNISAINQYAETILFLVIGVVTGLLAGKERRERERNEQTTLELQQAYHEYITKPFDREKLLLTVARGLEYAALARENHLLRQFIRSHFSLDDVSFKDPPENLTAAAATGAAANVLIQLQDDGIDLEGAAREIRSG